MKVAASEGETTEFVLGYRKLGSHELLPVRECPTSSPLINRAISAVWDAAMEHDLPNGLSEIEFFADHEDASLLCEFLTESPSDNTALLKFAKALKQKLPQIKGIAVIPRPHFENEAIAAPELDGGDPAKPTTLLGAEHLDYKVGAYSYRVRAGSFFQTNRHLSPKLIELACTDARGKLAIDLYAGAGLFTLPLAQNFERVIAVESSSSSFADLKVNAPRHVKTLEATTEMFLSRAPRQPDFVVVDPPRAGLGKRVVAGLAKLAPKSLAYVSCDPSTLARDLPGLTAAGYRITAAHLVDLFPQTFHIETVLRMER
jgi:23S rRNA (uracil1939-C5)-methyltransferase